MIALYLCLFTTTRQHLIRGCSPLPRFRPRRDCRLPPRGCEFRRALLTILRIYPRNSLKAGANSSSSRNAYSRLSSRCFSVDVRFSSSRRLRSSRWLCTWASCCLVSWTFCASCCRFERMPRSRIRTKLKTRLLISRLFPDSNSNGTRLCGSSSGMASINFRISFSCREVIFRRELGACGGGRRAIALKAKFTTLTSRRAPLSESSSSFC